MNTVNYLYGYKTGVMLKTTDAPSRADEQVSVICYDLFYDYLLFFFFLSTRRDRTHYIG